MHRRKPEPAGIFHCVKKPGLYDQSQYEILHIKAAGEGAVCPDRPKVGEAYSLEGIAKRIGERIHAQGFSQDEKSGAAGTRPDEKGKTKRIYTERPRYRITGFKALYIRYCYMLGCYPGKHMTAKQVNYLYREDLTKLRKIRSETKFLCNNKIETLQDLTDVEYELKQDLEAIPEQKKLM